MARWSQSTRKQANSCGAPRCVRRPTPVLTGAVRIVKGKVIVGSSGADNASRGFFAAYDADTGKQMWRFYTVPGDPSKGFEHPELEMAAKTWTGEWWKAGGGGGTAWDGMAYDDAADILYVGTGNGGPWNAAVRSPQGGDNLFLSSIIRREAGHRQDGLVFPGDTRRNLGLYRCSKISSWRTCALAAKIARSCCMPRKMVSSTCSIASPESSSRARNM